MSGEYTTKIGKDFVDKVCFFLEGNFGFHVYQNCYEGKNAASILVDGERIRFDLIVFQTRRELSPGQNMRTYRVNFFCECKCHKNPKNLKLEFKKFLEKALKSFSEIQGQYSDNFGFMFICNRPFGFSNKKTFKMLKN
jgi:hypothetical protein